MIRKIRTNSLRILLVLAVLWTQSAIAQHGADHLWHDVTEVCQTLVNADHVKFLSVTPANHVVEYGSEVVFVLEAQSVATQLVASHHARSPPL